MIELLEKCESMIDGPIGDLLTGDQMAEIGVYELLREIRTFIETNS